MTFPHEINSGDVVAAAVNVGNICGEALASVAETFTCIEADQIYEMLRAVLGDDGSGWAHEFERAHAASDDEGDLHYKGDTNDESD